MDEDVGLKLPKTYFDLISKAGNQGPYQRNVFLAFSLNWFVAGFLLMGVSFMFLNPKFDCEAHGIQTQNCDDTICAMDPSQWQQYLEAPLVKSMATQFGPYLCGKEQQLLAFRTILYVGTLVGYFTFLFITDNFGRKISLVVTWSVTVFGVFFLCIAQNMAMACFGLFFAGAGAESAIRINMAVFGQIVDYHKRQKYSVALQIAFGLSGVLVGVFYWLIRQWRIITIIFVGIPCILVLLFYIFYLEQTPKFLVTKKGLQKTVTSLNRIARINGNTQSITKQDVQRVFEEEELGGDKYSKIIIKPYHLFTYKSLRGPTIGCALVFMLITYIYFGPIIIVDSLGFDAFLAQILLSLSELLSYPISFCFIHKLPRIKSGYICFSISTILTGILIFVVPPQGCDGCVQVVFRAILMFGSRFVISFYFSIFFLYVTQIFPLRARGLGFGIASSFGAIATSSGQFVFRQMERKGINPMIFFTIFSILAIIVLKFLKETLNQPLQTEIKQIQNLKDHDKHDHDKEDDIVQNDNNKSQGTNSQDVPELDSHRKSLEDKNEKNIQMIMINEQKYANKEKEQIQDDI